MLFMVIERFKDRDPIPVYKRVRDQGIKFPEGLTYVGSWIEPNFDRCFQLMECHDARLLQEWVLNCQGLGMTFEIVPVVPSKETREAAKPGETSRFRAALPSQPLLLAMDPARPFVVGTLASPAARFRSDQRGACQALLGKIWHGLAFQSASPVRCRRRHRRIPAGDRRCCRRRACGWRKFSALARIWR